LKNVKRAAARLQSAIFRENPEMSRRKKTYQSNGIVMKYSRLRMFEKFSLMTSSWLVIKVCGSALVPFTLSGTDESPNRNK
ncbi:hypothetical protein, partial [Salinicoccus roseus]|uniref:hypothetical protein n=1 Tax=Salinicoccus roseus TaxID=45670 RepID=UPI003566DCED